MTDPTTTPPTVSAPDLAAIRARVEAATPGPWEWVDSPRRELANHTRGVLRCAALAHPDPADAAFIAHARQDVPALLAALDAARAETEQYRRNEVTLTGELSRARQDAAEFCGQRDEARAALAALREQYRDLATYRTTHANLGLCPEGPDDPARDPDCPVCAALGR